MDHVNVVTFNYELSMRKNSPSHPDNVSGATPVTVPLDTKKTAKCERLCSSYRGYLRSTVGTQIDPDAANMDGGRLYPRL